MIDTRQLPLLAANPQKEGDDGVLHVDWQKTISTRRREIIVPEGTGPQYARPIRAETRATLIASIARGRRCSLAVRECRRPNIGSRVN